MMKAEEAMEMTSRPQMMTAATIRDYGGAEAIRLERLPVPSLAADEVLVKVSATSFNPFDAKLRSGAYRHFLPLAFPFVLGVNVSGVVAAAGGETEGFQEGDRVYAFLDVTKNGASAEYVAVKAADVAFAPESMDLRDAAAVPSVALTAWQALFDHAGLQPGQRVLITAASGGVGTMAIQLAKRIGAYVIGTASSRSIPLMERLGADETVDDRARPIAEAVDGRVDAIINLSPVGKDEVTALLPLLKEGGTLVSAVSTADEAVAKALGVKAVRMSARRSAAQLKRIAELIDAGTLRPIIAERTRLSELSALHRRYDEGNVTGRVVVAIDAADRIISEGDSV